MRNVTFPCTFFAYSSGGYLNGSSAFCITGSESGTTLDCSASIIFFASSLSMHPWAATAHVIAVKPTSPRHVRRARTYASCIALAITNVSHEPGELFERLEWRHVVDVQRSQPLDRRMRCAEECELLGWRRRARHAPGARSGQSTVRRRRAHGSAEGGGHLRTFTLEQRKHLARARQHLRWKSRKTPDLDPVGTVRTAWL